MKRHWPWIVGMAVALLFTGWRLSMVNWNAAGLAQIGTRFSEGASAGSEGYDGQFAYYMALIPDPQTVDVYLDVPAYRYQRILLPALARLLVLGQEGLVGWSLLIVNLAGYALGLWAIEAYLRDQGQRPAYALGFGLWIGFLSGVALDLNEPLAYGLVAAAWLALTRRRFTLAALVFSLAALAKETTLVFWAAALIAIWVHRRGDTGARLWILLPGALWLGWQGHLWATFGHPGVGSGGAMGSAFEAIPFMGLVRVGMVDLRVLLLYLLIFGPGILLPTIWGMWAAGRRLLSQDRTAETISLLLNAGVIVFLPFSTFREPFGLVRLATGLVLAVILFASTYGIRRVLNYSLFWSAYLIMLVRT
jgi:hypothetical protein